MAARDDLPLSFLTKKLSKLVPLEQADREAIASLPHRMSDVTAGAWLVRVGTIPTGCCVIDEGYACRHKTTAEGDRQIVSFHMRGDMLDLQHLLLDRADHNIQTISPARIAWIPRAALRSLAHRRPRVGDALWKASLIDAAIFREWVLNVGRRDARVRVAHMICEFVLRCEAAGLGPAKGFALPMTQEQIGDATGLTAVHVNRMLRALSEEGLIDRSGREIRIADWAGLRALAEFDPSYLHDAA